MSYRIRRGRPIGEELERIAARLAEPPDAALDPEKRVHEFRKNTKKLRAIARLLGRKDDSGRFRDAARRYAGARDAAVLLATCEAVAEEGECPELRALLTAGAEEARSFPPIEPLALDWDLERFGESELRAACRRWYRKARRALRRAAADPRPDRLHAWRKRVKDHWYHMRLVGSDRRGPLREMADLLGDANDLAVLARTIEASGTGDRLIPRIEAKRTGLVARALALGEELFRAKPATFATSLRLR